MPQKRKRKQKLKLPDPHLVKVQHSLKVGDEVEFLKITHFDNNGFNKGDKAIISKIEECKYSTGGWMVWLEGTLQSGPGYSIYYFIDKEFPSAWNRNE